MKRENKKEYLRRILGIKPGDPGYADMETVTKEFNTFMRKLNIKKCEGTPAEKIFVGMHNNGITVASIVAKGRNREDIIQDMKDALLKSNEYYDTVLKPQYMKAARSSCHSISDMDLVLCEKEKRNSVVGRHSDPETFLNHVEKHWREANNYLSETIHLVFSGRYDIYQPSPLRLNEFGDVVEEEINYYNNHKIQYTKSTEELKDSCYHGANDNPYKNLYLHYLNAYMKQYYKFDLPDITVDRFYSLKKFEGIAEEIKKKVFSLRDIAELHSLMSGVFPNRIYENMKKKFKKLKFMTPYKKTGKYEFSDATLPLAAYEYYKKKNHIEEDHGIALCQFDSRIVYVYAPILKALILRKKEDLDAYIKYREFLISEYEGLLSRVDDCFQNIFLEMLLDSPMRLKYRYAGLEVTRLIDGC